MTALIAKVRAKLPAFVALRIAFLCGAWFTLVLQGALVWFFMTGGTLLGYGPQ